VSRVILLDSGPLGLATNPKPSPRNNACNQWVEMLVSGGDRVLVPEISDYEVRRELLRAGKIRGIVNLNEFKRRLGYLPITTSVMLKAAEFWAQTRRMGKQTAGNAALDGDVILAAQAAILLAAGHSVIVATTNVKHLDLFVDAQLWSDVT